MGTFVKIYRDIFDRDLNGDFATVSLFVYLIAKSNRFETKFRGETLPPGSVRRSIKIIRDDLGMTKRVFWRCLDKLEKLQMVVTIRGRKGTQISICNYLKYQEECDHDGDKGGGTIHVWLPEDALEKIKKISEKKQITMSTLARLILLDAARPDLEFGMRKKAS